MSLQKTVVVGKPLDAVFGVPARGPRQHRAG